MFGASKFDADRDIPDLTGKVVLVTGGMSIPMWLNRKNSIKRRVDLEYEENRMEPAQWPRSIIGTGISIPETVTK